MTVGYNDDAASDQLGAIDRRRLEGMVERGRIHPAELSDYVRRHLRFDDLGRALMTGSASIDRIAELEPSIVAAFSLDLDRPDVLDRWGLSTSVDGDSLVPAPVTQWIADALGRRADPTRCHAGLTHTYGYLFSPVGTDYGRKRHRWTTQEVAHTLGIAGDWPLNSTTGILTAVTEALDAVAPLDREPLLGANASDIQADVTIEVGGSGTTEGGPPWTSRLRIVRRAYLGTSAPGDGDGDELLLVYSLAVGDGPERYITAFPVTETYAASLKIGDHSRLRFLAVAE